MDLIETAENISLHGLGFVQIKLQGNQRLHVWHPELPRRECFEHSQIHDHRFGFNSLILIGNQVNITYTLVPNEASICTHDTYKHEGERTKFGNRPWIYDGSVQIYKHSYEIAGPGQIYKMLPFVYHATKPLGDGKVATIMTKTYEDKARGAHSVCKYGVDPEMDFNRFQWNEKQLWEIVHDVLGGIK